MYDTNPSPYEIERSLLQKAVRRGNVELVEKVFEYLLNNGNRTWLRDRLAVMTYEECWTYGSVMIIESNDYKLMGQYTTLARTVKNKNAAGLATLASKLSKGNESALVGDGKQQKAIRTVSNAISKPVDFWNWIKTEPEYDINKHRIEAAKKAMTSAKIPGDEVMMLAAAYLSIRYPIPATSFMNPNNNPNFPYWIAFDKHTSIGKEIMSEACAKINLLPYDGYQLAFYFAGALCNSIKDPSFFELAKQWQFKHMGFDCNQAKEKWRELRAVFVKMSRVEVEVRDMNNKINTVIKNDSDQFDLSL